MRIDVSKEINLYSFPVLFNVASTNGWYNIPFFQKKKKKAYAFIYADHCVKRGEEAVNSLSLEINMQKRRKVWTTVEPTKALFALLEDLVICCNKWKGRKIRTSYVGNLQLNQKKNK